MYQKQFSFANAGFGLLLLSYRQKFGVTLPELSSDSGIPLSVLEQIELGNLSPDSNVLSALSLYFHEDFDFPGNSLPDTPANNN